MFSPTQQLTNSVDTLCHAAHTSQQDSCPLEVQAPYYKYKGRAVTSSNALPRGKAKPDVSSPPKANPDDPPV